MADRDLVDAAAPWTIKSVSVATREAVTAAARREGLTVGQWLERRVAEWEAEGSPMPVSGPAPPGPAPNLGDLAQAWQAARALAEAAGIPVPPHLARDAFAAVKQATRQARGLPLPARRRKLPPAPTGNPSDRSDDPPALQADLVKTLDAPKSGRPPPEAAK